MLAIESGQPLQLVGTPSFDVHALGQRDAPRQVGGPGVVELAGGDQLPAAVVPDRLQHPEPDTIAGRVGDQQ